MEMNRLKHLYIEELKDLYSAETQLVKALPKMANAASSEDLRAGFEEHLGQTKEHVARLEKIFKALGESAKGKKCKGMEGLIKEGSELIGEDPAPEELDAGLISAAQRVEHYEIAGYGCVSTYAKLLRGDEAASLLRLTLEEEKETDEKLTQLASNINLEAVESEESEEGSNRSRKARLASSWSNTVTNFKRRNKYMKVRWIVLPRLLLPLVSLMFGVSLMATPIPGYQDPQQTPTDNTKQNKDQTNPTADQQKMNPADRALTQKIRKAIHQDSSLSTYAHNIKIITQDGKVTLRGPVRSEDEKTSIEAKAVAVAGQGNVTNQLEVAPAK
jgi:ferritin-like metal-binding protein YciE